MAYGGARSVEANVQHCSMTGEVRLGEMGVVVSSREVLGWRHRTDEDEGRPRNNKL